jgi:hypothetical protein
MTDYITPDRGVGAQSVRLKAINRVSVVGADANLTQAAGIRWPTNMLTKRLSAVEFQRLDMGQIKSATQVKFASAPTGNGFRSLSSLQQWPGFSP